MAVAQHPPWLSRVGGWPWHNHTLWLSAREGGASGIGTRAYATRSRTAVASALQFLALQPVRGGSLTPGPWYFRFVQGGARTTRGARRATSSRVPGSSNRCEAPGTISSLTGADIWAIAWRFSAMTGVSAPPTISSVGALTRASASPARSGRPPRETTACDGLRPLGRRHQRRPAAGAGPEVADLQAARLGLLAQPVGGVQEPPRPAGRCRSGDGA